MVYVSPGGNKVISISGDNNTEMFWTELWLVWEGNFKWDNENNKIWRKKNVSCNHVLKSGRSFYIPNDNSHKLKRKRHPRLQEHKRACIVGSARFISCSRPRIKNRRLLLPRVLLILSCNWVTIVFFYTRPDVPPWGVMTFS